MSVEVHSRQFSASWLEGSSKLRLVLLTVVVLLASVALARLVLLIDVFVVGLIAAWLILLAVAMELRFGLYILFAVVLLFESASHDPLMAPGFFASASPQASLHIPGLILQPFEMFLLLLAGLWLASAATRHRLDFRSGTLGRPMLLFGLTLMFGIIRGLLDGAIFNIIFWESRYLVAMVFCYFVAANTIRTRGHVRTLLTLIFVCVSLSSVEAIFRKVAFTGTGEPLGSVQEFWFEHSDVVFWGVLIMLVLAQQVFGAPRWQRILGPPMVLATTVAMLVSERRAGFVAVIVAFVVFALVLARVNRKAFFLLAVPVLVIGAVYLPLFWNNNGTIGQPARAVRSLSAPDPRDAASNAWRDLEAINVRATILSNPLAGVGFGKPFLQVVPVPDISFFIFWNYESHHNILWVWMKTGAIGFICFFTILTGGLARSVWVIRRATDFESRTFGVVAISTILLTVVFCYVDLGLTGARVPMLLGVVLGTLGVLDRLPQTLPSPSRS